MKLLSCHIDAFGKLKDLDVEFSPQITAFCEENGWGKSTLAAFLRAMFYGLSGDRKRKTEDNERQRFEPWEGGAFGGRLTFEAAGKTYTAFRQFRRDGDVFELRDARTNLPSGDYSENLGRELFGIDRASFLRTVFLDQNDLPAAATDDVSARISNLSENTNDMNNYQTADQALKDLLGMYGPRKTGELGKLSGTIAALAEKERGFGRLEEALDGQNRSLEELRRRKAEQAEEAVLLGGRLQRSSTQAQILAKKAQYQDLLDRTQRLQDEQWEAADFFPGTVPDTATVDAMSLLIRDLQKSEQTIGFYLPSPEERQQLSALEREFSGGIPSDEDLKKASNAERSHAELRREEAAQQLSEEETARLSGLTDRFGDSEAPGGVLEKWGRRSEERTRQREASVQRREKELQLSDIRRRQMHMTFLLIGGLAAAAVGIALCFLLRTAEKLWMPGWIIAAAGAVCALAGLILRFRAARTGSKEELKRGIEALALEERRLAASADDAEEYCAAYVRSAGEDYTEETAGAVLRRLCEEYTDYAALREKRRKAEENAPGKQADRLKDVLSRFLERFGKPCTEPAEELEALRSERRELGELREKKQKCLEAQKEAGERFDGLQVLLGRCGLTPAGTGAAELAVQADQIRSAATLYRQKSAEAEKALGEQQAFEEKNDVEALLAFLPEEDLPEPAELSRQIQALRQAQEDTDRQLQETRTQLHLLEEQYDERTRVREELAEKQTRKAQLEAAVEDVQNARRCLTQARESVTARYSEPIRQAFRGYMSRITSAQAGHYYVDASARVTVEGGGLQRDPAVLSTGLRDLTGFCLRLALVDAMYRAEKPVLVMDDPFVNLDPEKAAQALDLLEEVSRDYQIIYFTCSGHRMPAAGREENV
ncbi:MAG: AAA family ATPase [Lachnospiraceae bacterium]|nr:AAA family ATPase [Lachnospiraceae bacterium]